jgi:hypothetical protein
MPSMTASCPTVALSAHARQRAQQRAIQPDLLEMLLDHGERRPAGRGAEIVHLTAAGHRECAAEEGVGRAARLKSIYAVIAADGRVVTVGHRYSRLGRH